jgi:hypothetical protein
VSVDRHHPHALKELGISVDTASEHTKRFQGYESLCNCLLILHIDVLDACDSEAVE